MPRLTNNVLLATSSDIFIVECKKKSDKKKKRSSSDKGEKAARRRSSSSSSSRDGSHHSATTKQQQEQSTETGKIVSTPVDFIIPGRLELPSSSAHRSTGGYGRHRRPPLTSTEAPTLRPTPAFPSILFFPSLAHRLDRSPCFFFVIAAHLPFATITTTR